MLVFKSNVYIFYLFKTFSGHKIIEITFKQNILVLRRKTKKINVIRGQNTCRDNIHQKKKTARVRRKLFEWNLIPQTDFDGP